jgi:hypothetical protein
MGLRFRSESTACCEPEVVQLAQQLIFSVRVRLAAVPWRMRVHRQCQYVASHNLQLALRVVATLELRDF